MLNLRFFKRGSDILPKKYKMKKRKEQEQENPAEQKVRRERTPEERREHKKIALFLVGWFVLVASVYFAFVQTQNQTVMFGVMLAYLILGVIFFLLWMVFNGGLKKFDPERYEKPDEMGYDEFCSIIDKLKERHRKSKYFMVIFMPFFLVMLIDYLTIVWS